MPTPLHFQTPDSGAVARWLAGESPPEEAAVVRAWVESDEHRRRTASELKELDHVGSDPRMDIDSMWNTLAARLVGNTVASPVPGAVISASGVPQQFSKLGRRTVGKAGRQTMLADRQISKAWTAVFVATVIAVLGIVIGTHGKSSASTTRTYATRAGEQTTIKLDDRTFVKLAPQTILEVSPAYGRTDRSVRLTGEAYFDVSASTTIPFVVHTRTVTTRVLGTAFGVRRYAADHVTQVRVASGRVLTTSRRASVAVAAGMTAMVTDSTTTTSVNNPQSYTDWAQERLVFKDTKVSTMLETVGRWYGYRFAMTDSALATQSVSVVFRIADSKDMMVILEDVLNVTMTVTDSVITLRPRRVDRHTPVKAPVRYSPLTELGR